jgi:hypothetical protein
LIVLRILKMLIHLQLKNKSLSVSSYRRLLKAEEAIDKQLARRSNNERKNYR